MNAKQKQLHSYLLDFQRNGFTICRLKFIHGQFFITLKKLDLIDNQKCHINANADIIGHKIFYHVSQPPGSFTVKRKRTVGLIN